jgi:glycogen phosphorylase/synthase
MTTETEALFNPYKPDYIFEVSWEVCNKVGGIYTVISTKYHALRQEVPNDQVIMIGPDVWKETSEHPDFEEDLILLKDWRELAALQGLYFRVGRWKIEGRPLSILVDFTSYFPKKDEIFARFWEDYGLDSISGQWDYVEPVMFGYTAAKVIESFYRTHLNHRDMVIAHFHEWMTGSGVLYLKKNTPGIATAFTTHATVLGRSIAGNGRPLYSSMSQVNPDIVASEFQVKSKHSLEKLAARHADLFTTVSGVTANETTALLAKKPDVITPNGFDPGWVPPTDVLKEKRSLARTSILSAASKMFDTDFPDDTLLVLNSGRYEFRNKGIDLFIDAAGALSRKYPSARKTIAVIAVPAYHHGPRPDLMQRISGQKNLLNGTHNALTHLLNHPENDPVLRRIDQQLLLNKQDDQLFILFVPTYLDGHDGIFDLKYYDFLSGFDLTLFPSYYEPWGYTPLESVAFGIPTVTTNLAGFGVWVIESSKHNGKGVKVIPRTDFNDSEVSDALAGILEEFLMMTPENYLEVSADASLVAHQANWTEFIQFYLHGYQDALIRASDRAQHDPYLLSGTPLPKRHKEAKLPTWHKVLIRSVYPQQLERLKKLANNLWWCWNPEATALFSTIDPSLWLQSGNSPRKLLSLLKIDDLHRLAQDDAFLKRLDHVWHLYQAYMEVTPAGQEPHVAYFSMEFGLHESLKIYSGGLGILAGDYLKEASDSNRRMTGIGLLYRYGYFTQQITPYGDQVSENIPQKFSDLPIHAVRDEHGEWIRVSIAFPGRTLYAKVWEVWVGRIKLYLLDTDLEMNAPHDRAITHQLYGGDWENRLKQELLLGVGGIRLLEKLDIKPDVFHCNEGHAAFINFERIRDLVQREFLTFEEALEVVRSSTLFTTHTPVPAGHDRFSEDLLRAYISHYPERLHISWNELMALGMEYPENPGEQFSMSVLAIKTAQFVNGVSKIHGEVSRQMFKHLFDGYFSEELHIGHVTNGVHYPTWTNARWQTIHQRFLMHDGISRHHQFDAWSGIASIEDREIWETRNTLRKELLQHLKGRVNAEMTRRQDPPGHIVRVVESLDQPMLTIGFARRFATYKRAHLLFSNEERLLQLVSNKRRPIRFLFAGKAHPSDKAGQDLIKRIVEIGKKSEFAGKILFVENYDMELGRYLTQGCDIWLNTPMRPQEASGTSGEKAVMNGVLNLSVLDGWWAEGYQPEAGWALPEERAYQEQSLQDQLDAETIYNLLEERIAPLFYDRNKNGIPEGWIQHIKNNFREITPHFTMRRMVDDYYRQYYHALAERYAEVRADNYRQARIYATWKRRLMVHWENIAVIQKDLPDSTNKPLNLGEPFNAEMVVHAPGLTSNDLKMEVIFGEKVQNKVERIFLRERLECSSDGNGKLRFTCNVKMPRAGVFDYAFRITPDHPLMPHGMDFPLVKWVE